MARSVVSVLGGGAVWALLSWTTSRVVTARFGYRFHDDGSIDEPAILLLVLTLHLAFALAAGWVTGWLVKHDEVAHAVGLGTLLMVAGALLQIQGWHLLPLWYHLLFQGFLAPGVIAGGWLRELQGRDVLPASQSATESN